MSDYSYAANLIASFESFAPVAHWDVNAYRLGYGSDTEGPEQRHVTHGMTTTKARAAANLERRIPAYAGEIVAQVGEHAWSKIPKQAQGALLSVAYNYGHLPVDVAQAVARGASLSSIAAEVFAHRHDNHGVNLSRREKEAAIIRSGK